MLHFYSSTEIIRKIRDTWIKKLPSFSDFSLIFPIFVIFTLILSYLDSQNQRMTPNTNQGAVECYIPSLYTDICQIRDIWMPNLPY